MNKKEILKKILSKNGNPNLKSFSFGKLDAKSKKSNAYNFPVSKGVPKSKHDLSVKEITDADLQADADKKKQQRKEDGNLPTVGDTEGVIKDAYTEGYTAGFHSGSTDGYSDGEIRGESDGREEGEKRGYEEGYSNFQSDFNHFKKILESMQFAKESFSDRIKQEVLGCIKPLAKAVILTDVQTNDKSILELIDVALATIPFASSETVLYLCKPDLIFLRNYYSEEIIKKNKWMLKEDSSLSRSEIRIETNDSKIDLTFDERIKRVLDSLPLEKEGASEDYEFYTKILDMIKLSNSPDAISDIKKNQELKLELASTITAKSEILSSLESLQLEKKDLEIKLEHSVHKTDNLEAELDKCLAKLNQYEVDFQKLNKDLYNSKEKASSATDLSDKSEQRLKDLMHDFDLLQKELEAERIKLKDANLAIAEAAKASAVKKVTRKPRATKAAAAKTEEVKKTTTRKPRTTKVAADDVLSSVKKKVIDAPDDKKSQTTSSKDAAILTASDEMIDADNDIKNNAAAEDLDSAIKTAKKEIDSMELDVDLANKAIQEDSISDKTDVDEGDSTEKDNLDDD